MAPVRLSWVHSLLEEHETLLDYVARARDVVDTAEAGVDRTQLLWILEQIDTHLGSHMTLEEQDGYLEAVRERLPHRSEEVERLQGEHATLREGLASVMRAVESTTDPQALTADVAPLLQRWLTQLSRHEDHENALMQEAFNADYGSGD